jgi:polyisoprenyl-teichoic acid--peptidoglycan teichoic acid transferase
MAEKSTNKRVLTEKQKAAKKRNRIVLLIVEVIILLVLLAVLYKVVTTLGSNNDGEGGRVAIGDVTINPELQESIDEAEKSGEEIYLSQYRNIALFGVDSLNGSLGSGNRTDTIIVASINLETKEVKLVSVFRDTYLNVGSDTYRKANNAYKRGGAEQAMGMLNMNLDLNIADFVTVGFEGLKETIDLLGGIEIEVDSEELKHINNYQQTMAKSMGVDYVEVTETGLQKLDGLQATAYCRIRYTAGNDYKRTARQREVIEKIVEKAQKASLSTLSDIANAVFPKVATSLELKEILSLLSSVNEYTMGDNTGFPFEEDRTTGDIGSNGSCVVPTTLAENVTTLHEFLFNETDYEPTDSVKTYSRQIYEDTVPYVVQDDPDAEVVED